MSTSEPVALPGGPRLLAVITAMLACAVIGLAARFLDPIILAAGVVGFMIVLVIRAHPMETLLGLAATRAALEVTQAHNIVHAAGVKLSPADLVEVAFFGAIGLLVLREAWTRNADFWRSPIIVPAAIFLAFGVMTLVFSPAIGEGARGIVKWGSAFGAYVVLTMERPDEHRLRQLLWLVLASSVFPLLYGGYQLVNGIGRQNLLHGGLRIQSTFDHPNDYGFYLVVVLVAMWGLYNVVEPRTRVYLMVYAVPVLGSCALTLSRSAYAAGGLVVLFVGWKYRKLLIALGAVGVAILVVAPRVLGRVTDLANPRAGDNHGNSLLGRLSIWQGEVQFFKQRPIFGHGWGFTLVDQDKAAHNDYLRMLVEGGFFGFLTILAVMISLLRAAWRASRRRIDLPRAFLGLALGYAIDSGVTNTIGKGAFQFYFWLMAGISLRWAVVVPPVVEFGVRDTTEAPAEEQPDLEPAR